MHLWQIRHIPNVRQTLLGLTATLIVVAIVVVTGLGLVTYAVAQDGDVTAQVKKATPDLPLASEFLQQVRQELPKYRSIKADLLQQIVIGDQQLKVTGEYLSAGPKLRVAYVVMPDQGADGKMLEVSDGKDLWTLISLSDSKRVTHRSLQQIYAAMSEAETGDLPNPSAQIELGLGGVTGLLASLERTMNFEAIKPDRSQGRELILIQGTWKKEFAAQFPKDKKDDSFPAYVPDAVRISFDAGTLFPDRLVYLKRLPQKKAYRPMVSLEFRNVEFDTPFDDEFFSFKVPDGVVPEDVTKQYIDRITGTAAK